jgi:hypothetical protein
MDANESWALYLDHFISSLKQDYEAVVIVFFRNLELMQFLQQPWSQAQISIWSFCFYCIILSTPSCTTQFSLRENNSQAADAPGRLEEGGKNLSCAAGV